MASYKIMSSLANIPDDIIVKNILPCLPSKSLGQFKSVSKKWYREISLLLHHRFLASGWIFIKDQRVALLSTLHDTIHTLNPFLDYVSNPVLDICASSNGLLCLHLEECLYVCNPMTRQGYRIPDSKNMLLVSLVFEPLISSDHYKLLYLTESITEDLLQKKFQFEVFSSSDKKWVKSDKEATTHFSELVYRRSVSVKGVVYWRSTNYLLWFDCGSDNVGYIKLPPGSTSQPHLAIGILEDCVSCASLGPDTIQIWVLVDVNNNGGKWDLNYRLSFRKSKCGYIDILPPYSNSMREKPHIFLYRCVTLPPFGGRDKLFLTEMYVVGRSDGRVYGMRHEVCERLLSLDLKSGKMTKVFSGELMGGGYAYGYDNSSLVSLPNNGENRFEGVERKDGDVSFDSKQLEK